MARLGRILEDRKGLTSSLSFTQWAELFSSLVEREALDRAARSTISSAMARSYRWGASKVGLSLSWNPELSPLDQQIGEMITRVTKTTETTIRGIVENGLAEGLTVNEMQQQIAVSADFGLPRSLTIARAETTRAVSGGSYAAFQDAVSQGVMVRQQWLSARDSAARATHWNPADPDRSLDGQEVAVGERFQIPGSHRKALYPGGFGVPGEDINCRCTVIPIVD